MIDTTLVVSLDRDHTVRVKATQAPVVGDGWNEPCAGGHLEDVEVLVVRQRKDGRCVERPARIGDETLSAIEDAVLRRLEAEADDGPLPAPRRTHPGGCEFPAEPCRCAANARAERELALDRVTEADIDDAREGRA